MIKTCTRFVCAVALVCCVSALLVPAFAAEDITPGDADTVTGSLTAEADDKNIIVNITVPAVTAPEDSAPVETPDVSDAPDVSPAPSFESYTTYDLSPVEVDAAPSDDGDAQSFSAVLVSLFGEYHPRVQTVTEHLADGTTVSYQEYVPGLAGLDYTWLSGVLLFTVALYCVFRMVGGVFKCL